jgi:hypothetical protein
LVPVPLEPKIVYVYSDEETTLKTTSQRHPATIPERTQFQYL